MATESSGLMSLHDLYYQRRYLFVNPLKWTAHHLEQVGCKFEFEADPPSSEPATTSRRSSNIRLFGKEVIRDDEPGKPLTKEEKVAAMFAMIMGEAGVFANCSPCPPFSFADVYEHNPYSFLYYRQDYHPDDFLDPHQETAVSYVDASLLRDARNSKYNYRRDPRGLPNYPGMRIRDKKIKKITPAKWDEDPYIICCLFAMAQAEEDLEKEVAARTKEKPEDVVHTVRMILSNARVDGSEYICVYTAEISSALLTTLKRPRDAKVYIAWPTVKVEKVPYAPLDTFKARVIATLGLPDGAVNQIQPRTDADDLLLAAFWAAECRRFERGRKRAREDDDEAQKELFAESTKRIRTMDISIELEEPFVYDLSPEIEGIWEQFGRLNAGEDNFFESLW